MKKKWITAITAVCLSFAAIGTFSACDNRNNQGNNKDSSTPDEPTNQLEYEFNDKKNGYIVTGIGTYADTVLNIPEVYNNEYVLEIADGAFFENDTIVEVNIPNGIKRIGDCAFYKCENLKEISLGSDIEEIGSNAFSHCYAVQNLYYNARCLYRCGDKIFDLLGENSYGVAGNGLNVTIGTATTRIEERLFETSHIFTLNFEEDSHCNYIGGYAFHSTAIEELKLPDSLVYIEEGAFEASTNLRSVFIPSNVKCIYGSAFGWCHNLETIMFAKDSKLEIIGSNAFEHCKFTKIVLPDNVQSLGLNTFADCYYLTEIAIPDSVQGKLENDIFNGCTNLQSVIIGNGITEIGTGAFANCSNLQNLVVGNSVERIGRGSFLMTLNLKEIHIPSSVTSIGAYAFLGSALTNVSFENPENWVGTDYGNNENLLCVEDVYNSEKIAIWLKSYYNEYAWSKPQISNLLVHDAQLGIQSTAKADQYGDVYFQMEIPYATFYTVTSSAPIIIYNEIWGNGSRYQSGQSFALPVGTWYFKIESNAFADIDLLVEPKGATISLGNDTIVSYTANNVYAFTPEQTAQYTISTWGSLNNTLTSVISVKKFSDGEWIDIRTSNEMLYPSLTLELTKDEEVFIFIALNNASGQAFLLNIDHTDENLRDLSAPVQISLQTENYLTLQEGIDKTLTFIPDKSGTYQIRALIWHNETLTANLYKNGVHSGSFVFEYEKEYSAGYVLWEVSLQKNERYDFVLSHEVELKDVGTIYFVIDRTYDNIFAEIAQAETTAYKKDGTLDKENTYRCAMFGDGELLFNCGYYFVNGQWGMIEYDELTINETTETGRQSLIFSRYDLYDTPASVAQYINKTIEIEE